VINREFLPAIQFVQMAVHNRQAHKVKIDGYALIRRLPTSDEQCSRWAKRFEHLRLAFESALLVGLADSTTVVPLETCCSLFGL
jgi:hypothetical protein